MNTLENTKLNKGQRARYDLLVSRMGLGDKGFSKAVEEVLIFMACYWFNNIREINVCVCRYLFRVLGACKRIESCDVPWLFLWKSDYENEPNKDIKAEKLKWGVYFLIQEDMRCLMREYYTHSYFRNARLTFSEIHEDYSHVLGVSVEEVSSAITELINSNRVFMKKERVWQYANPNEDGKDCGNWVDGVVYLTWAFDKLDLVLGDERWIRK